MFALNSLYIGLGERKKCFEKKVEEIEKEKSVLYGSIYELLALAKIIYNDRSKKVVAWS